MASHQSGKNDPLVFSEIFFGEHDFKHPSGYCEHQVCGDFPDPLPYPLYFIGFQSVQLNVGFAVLHKRIEIYSENIFRPSKALARARTPVPVPRSTTS